ncbi:unnamed protein product [Dovyalis caffra]|uniref:C2H2-type domain-containing protein n=1 Tax=Dovyalis caffra TaxID=77055 RepID=A0AAV1S2W6_9ROSI|nr:unnamed protein product [Dovyalis caffra]
MDFDQDQTIGSKELTQIIKGKRTKRQRPSSPLTLALTSSSSSGGESGGERERIYNNSLSSPSTSVEFKAGNGEEEDMANCLILLAQGNQNCKLLSKPMAIAATTTNTFIDKDVGLYVYQCKTCNRRFPSFQALGGHRASHKKPKPAQPGNIDADKKALTTVRMGQEEINRKNIDMSTTLSLQIVNDRILSSTNVKSNKVHECSICGAEFSSGQALGGHMRRHRAFATTSTTTTTTTTMNLGSSPDHESQESKKPRNSLQLDLNLPAPEDDLRESKFNFASKEQVLVFTASPLVDCHY